MAWLDLCFNEIILAACGGEPGNKESKQDAVFKYSRAFEIMRPWSGVVWWERQRKKQMGERLKRVSGV